MLSASEYRIGNWVQAEKWNAFSDHSSLNCFPITGQDLASLEEETDEVDPIPLSQEWLLKANFQLVEESGAVMWQKSFKGGLFRLQAIHEGARLVYQWMDGLLPSPGIRFVHQLQNLYFALIGEELLITSKGDYINQ